MSNINNFISIAKSEISNILTDVKNKDIITIKRIILTVICVAVLFICSKNKLNIRKFINTFFVKFIIGVVMTVFLYYNTNLSSSITIFVLVFLVLWLSNDRENFTTFNTQELLAMSSDLSKPREKYADDNKINSKFDNQLNGVPSFNRDGCSQDCKKSRIGCTHQDDNECNDCAKYGGLVEDIIPKNVNSTIMYQTENAHSVSDSVIGVNDIDTAVTTTASNPDSAAPADNIQAAPVALYLPTDDADADDDAEIEIIPEEPEAGVENFTITPFEKRDIFDSRDFRENCDNNDDRIKYIKHQVVDRNMDVACAKGIHGRPSFSKYVEHI